MSLAGILRITRLFDDPATLAANPSAANVEHLHGGLEVIVGERHHVGVGAVAEHHRLLLQRPLQRGDVVPQSCRPLEVELLGGLVHLVFHVARQPVGLTRQEVAEVEHDLSVLFGRDPPDARCRALVDVTQQAWPIDLLVPLEDSRRTCARREHPGEQIKRLAYCPGMRVRPEVADTLAARPAVDHQPRVLLVERHRQHRVGLVVAVADVEPRIEFLDPVVLQLQRLDFGAHHRPLDAACGHHHLARPWCQPGDVGEVGIQPAAQALGLADVDDAAVRIAKPIDTGFDGNRPWRRTVRRWIGHGFQVTAVGMPP